MESYGWEDEHNPPLIVVDTMAASLECDDINAAAKASKLLAALRQCWRDYSILITMHTAKNSNGTEAMGSVAFKADMQNAFYLRKYEKDETRREGGFSKRRANGKIIRLITQVVDEVPKQLPNREGDMVTEWIPVVEIIGQSATEAKEMDAAFVERMPDGGAQKKAKLRSELDAIVQYGMQTPLQASSQRQLAAHLQQTLGDVAGSEASARRKVSTLIQEGRLVQEKDSWTFVDLADAEL